MNAPQDLESFKAGLVLSASAEKKKALEQTSFDKKVELDPEAAWTEKVVGQDIRDVDADTLARLNQGKDTGQTTRLTGSRPGVNPDAYESDPYRYENNKGVEYRHKQSYAAQNRMNVEDVTRDMLIERGKQQKGEGKQEFFGDGSRGILDTGEKDAYGRDLVRARNAQGEEYGDRMASFEESADYGSRYNTTTQAEDIASGKLAREMMYNRNRTPGEIVGDTAKRVGIGAGKMVAETLTELPLIAESALVGVFNLATDSDVEGPLSQVNRYFGATEGIKNLVDETKAKNLSGPEQVTEKRFNEDLNKFQEKGAERIKKYKEQGYGDSAATALNTVDEIKYAGGKLWEDPSRILSMSADSAASLFSAAGWGKAGMKLAKNKMQKQFGPDWESNPEAVEYARKQGAGFAVASGASTEATAAAAEMRNKVLAMSEEELAQSEQYQALREKGDTHEEAVGSLSQEAALNMAGIVATTSLIVAKATNVGGFESKLLGDVGPDNLTQNSVKEAAKRVGKNAAGGLKEAPQEAAESAGETIASTYTDQSILGLDLDKSLVEGAGASAVLGAASGTATGVTVGGASGAIKETGRAIQGQQVAPPDPNLKEGEPDYIPESVNSVKADRSYAAVPKNPKAQAINSGITKAAKKHNLPPMAEAMLRTITDIESGWGANTIGQKIGTEVSGDMKHAGDRAEGPFQFMTATAKGYGLKDRHDPDQSADAAARHLWDSYYAQRKKAAKKGEKVTEEELWVRAATGHHSGSHYNSLGKWGKDYQEKIRERLPKYLGSGAGTFEPQTGGNATAPNATAEDHQKANAARGKAAEENSNVVADEELTKKRTPKETKEAAEEIASRDENDVTLDDVEALQTYTKDLLINSMTLKEGSPEQIETSEAINRYTARIKDLKQQSLAPAATPEHIAKFGTPDGYTPADVSATRQAAEAGVLTTEQIETATFADPKIKELLLSATRLGQASEKVFGQKIDGFTERSPDAPGPSMVEHKDMMMSLMDDTTEPAETTKAIDKRLHVARNFVKSQATKLANFKNKNQSAGVKDQVVQQEQEFALMENYYADMVSARNAYAPESVSPMTTHYNPDSPEARAQVKTWKSAPAPTATAPVKETAPAPTQKSAEQAPAAETAPAPAEKTTEFESPELKELGERYKRSSAKLEMGTELSPKDKQNIAGLKDGGEPSNLNNIEFSGSKPSDKRVRNDFVDNVSKYTAAIKRLKEVSSKPDSTPAQKRAAKNRYVQTEEAIRKMAAEYGDLEENWDSALRDYRGVGRNVVARPAANINAKFRTDVDDTLAAARKADTKEAYDAAIAKLNKQASIQANRAKSSTGDLKGIIEDEAKTATNAAKTLQKEADKKPTTSAPAAKEPTAPAVKKEPVEPTTTNIEALEGVNTQGYTVNAKKHLQSVTDRISLLKALKDLC